MNNDRQRAEQRAEEILRRHTLATLCLAGAFAAVLVLAYFGWFWERPVNKTDPGAWGTFGDFMGGLLNPLVAFLALFWLTQSIQIQRRELRETRAALDEQSITLEKQRFEGTFFSLLDQHNKVLGDLSERNPNHTSLLSAIDEIHQAVFGKVRSLEDANKHFKTYDVRVGHYFRILYHIFKLIATSAPGSTLGKEFTPEAILATSPSDEEKRYANIVRAFLGTKVTQLLAINCYCSTSQSTYWKYKCLAERYALFEHMPFKANGNTQALKEAHGRYRISAFGSSEFLSEIVDE